MCKHVVWLNLKKITLLVSRWRSTWSIWIMEKIQVENLYYYLIKSSIPRSNFVFPALLDANNYWNNFCYVVKGSCVKTWHGYFLIGKQFHASTSIKKNFQARNHNRRKVNQKCTKFRMGRWYNCWLLWVIENCQFMSY